MDVESTTSARMRLADQSMRATCASDQLLLPRCVSRLVSKHQRDAEMSRLTITLSEARYKALKEAAVQRDKTIGQLIDESLEFYGIKSRADARELVRRARAHSRLPDDEAVAVSQEHVRAVRRRS